MPSNSQHITLCIILILIYCCAKTAKGKTIYNSKYKYFNMIPYGFLQFIIFFISMHDRYEISENTKPKISSELIFCRKHLSFDSGRRGIFKHFSYKSKKRKQGRARFIPHRKGKCWKLMIFIHSLTQTDLKKKQLSYLTN